MTEPTLLGLLIAAGAAGAAIFFGAFAVASALAKGAPRTVRAVRKGIIITVALMVLAALLALGYAGAKLGVHPRDPGIIGSSSSE